jgi:hypothetical protein
MEQELLEEKPSFSEWMHKLKAKAVALEKEEQEETRWRERYR